MKQCFKCRLSKELSEFYAHPQMADGHLNKCKECTKKDSSERYSRLSQTDPDWLKKEAARTREKSRRIKRTQRYPEAGKRWLEKYPEKRRAHSISQHLRPVTKGNHMHHWSYNPEHVKDCIELTPRHHGKAHRFMVYDQERMMYRRADNMELLDTRQKHEEFIHGMIQTQPD